MTQRTTTPGEAVTRPVTAPPATATTPEGHYWERARRGAAPWIVGAVGLAAIGAVQLFPVRHHLEGDLRDRSQAALQDAGLTGLTVDFTGRDGTVRGTVGSVADRDRAVELVGRVEGVRVVSADLRVPSGTTAPADTAAVRAVLANGTLALSGTVGTEAAHQALVTAVDQAVGQDKVTDGLTVDQARSDAGVNNLGALLAVVARGSTDATVELSGGRLTLTGTVADAATLDAATKAAIGVTGDVGRVTSQLTVAAPSASPSPSAAPSAAPSPSQSPSESPSPSPSATGTADGTQQSLTRLAQITFENGSATLTPAGRQVVEQAAAILRADPAVKVRIEGYTDDLGDWDVNKELSTARAETVKATLAAAGIDAGRLTTFGWSEENPQVPNTSAANRATNRRVAFVVQQ